MFINGHNTRTMYLKKKEKKRYIASSLHPSKRNNTPLNTMTQKLTLPLKMTTLISPKLLPLFVTSDKG